MFGRFNDELVEELSLLLGVSHLTVQPGVPKREQYGAVVRAGLQAIASGGIPVDGRGDMLPALHISIQDFFEIVI